MPVPTENTDYAGEAIGYLTDAYRSKQIIAAFVAAKMVSRQELEGVFWDIINLRRLANAVGAQLDVNGRIVGQPRNTASDGDYKAAITLRVAVNRSTGRLTDWSNFGAILLQTSSGPVSYYGGEASFFFGVWGMALSPVVVASVLAAAVPNGVRGVFAYSTWADGNDFEWADVNNLSTTGEGGFGDSVAGLVGGLLISAAEMP